MEKYSDKRSTNLNTKLETNNFRAGLTPTSANSLQEMFTVYRYIL